MICERPRAAVRRRLDGCGSGGAGEGEEVVVLNRDACGEDMHRIHSTRDERHLHPVRQHRCPAPLRQAVPVATQLPQGVEERFLEEVSDCLGLPGGH